MWIYCDHGFLSIVQSRENPALYIARARSRADLDGLLTYLKDRQSKTITLAQQNSSDYQWSVVADAVAISSYVHSRALDIDYPNFKNMIGHRQGEHRLRVYHNIWRNSLALETIDTDWQSEPPILPLSE
jgi:hypothetical protein